MLRRWCSRSALPLASGSIFFWDSSCTSCCELLSRKGEGLLEQEVLGDSFMAAYRSEQIKCNWQLQGPWLRNMSMSPSSLTAVLFVADYPELWLDPNEGHSAGCLSTLSLWACGEERLLTGQKQELPRNPGYTCGLWPWLKDAQMKSRLCAIY